VTECSHVHCEREACRLVFLEDTGDVLVMCEAYAEHLDDGQDYGPRTVAKPAESAQAVLDRFDGQ